MRSAVCEVEDIDFEANEKEPLIIGYPVLGLVHQVASLCRGNAGKYCHGGVGPPPRTSPTPPLSYKSRVERGAR
jgi:3-carboxy-cis,cis-muconate cycloisomerase